MHRGSEIRILLIDGDDRDGATRERLAKYLEAAGYYVDTMPVSNAREKNPHAAALGRLGGLKGGQARAARLSARRRRAIARKAARARWAGRRRA